MQKQRLQILPTALLLAVVATGCHHYTPIHVEELRPGMDVRARVSLQEAERLEAYLPRGDRRMLEGEFLGRQGESFVLQVPAVSELRGVRVETLHQRVSVPLAELLEVEARELSRGRTFLLAGAGVAVGTAILVATFGDSGRSERDVPPDDPGAESRSGPPIQIRLSW